MAAFFRAYIPVFAATLVLSAFLLFDVEPMFGKMVLPLLGGAPSVWNTAMVFFQAMLLGGYAYAHLSSRYLTVAQQAGLHILLLMICLSLLPISIPAGWPEPQESNPFIWQLSLMCATVGAPFFVLAGSAPMIQRWFAQSGHKDAGNPYFLYAASNIGSMVALLGYPFVTEPLFSLPEQSRMWTWGFGLLIAMTVTCAVLTLKSHRAGVMKSKERLPPIPGHVKLQWLILAFLPSSLMLGVTTFITTDLAAVPMLWVIPLALYVGTFIIAFSTRLAMKVDTIMACQTGLILIVMTLLFHDYLQLRFMVVAVHMALFFFSALLCHTLLAQKRPPAGQLTGYYLIMSCGGVLGGIFNALIAPVIFPIPFEYPLVLCAICFLRYFDAPGQELTRRSLKTALSQDWLSLVIVAACSAGAMIAWYEPLVCEVLAIVTLGWLLILYNRRIAFGIGMAFALMTHPAGMPLRTILSMLEIDRNFFGVTRVWDQDNELRMFSHGTTVHGTQPLIDPYKMVPMAYYHPQGPVGDIFGLLDRRAAGPQRIATLGLGVGSMACYVRPGRVFDFYEIDPIVVRLAQNTKLFTYLHDCGSPYSIQLGDGRLNMRHAQDHSYDLIFMDAFGSDSIPVHLMTQEAFALYLQKLKPGGFILANISNRFLNLAPVMQAAANAAGLKMLIKLSQPIPVKPPSLYGFASIDTVFYTDPEDESVLRKAGWGSYLGPVSRPWTDAYANPLATLWWTRPQIHKN